MILVNDVEKTLRDSILAQGLDVMAVVHANKSELPGLGREKPAAILLVGSSGSKVWPVFSASNEYLDGAPDSLDRWAKRIGEAVAKEFGVHVLFPFDGPPYWPFLTWASRSGLSSPSALGMHIHSEFGLWHAYRFALVIDKAEQKLPKERVSHAKSACEDCEEQPCLSACPAGAFSPGHYDVEKCSSFLALQPDCDCNKRGCIARRACPVAHTYQYEPEHAAFHMRAFVSTRTHWCRTT